MLAMHCVYGDCVCFLVFCPVSRCLASVYVSGFCVSGCVSDVSEFENVCVSSSVAGVLCDESVPTSLTPPLSFR